MEAHEDELGPIDIVVIGYPVGAPMTGDAMPMLLDLVDRKIIRVLDALFVVKDLDGTFTGFEATGLDEKGVGDLKAFEGASSGLLGDDDAAETASTMEPGTGAVMIVYENRWAGPLAAAIRRNGGSVLGFARVPGEALLESLEAAEAAA